MPTFPTVTIPMQLLGGQPIQMLGQLANMAAMANRNIKILQGGMQNLNTTGKQAAGFATGVGAFYILHRASTMAFGALKAGIGDAANLEQSLDRLQLVTRANASEMEGLRKEAIKVSNVLGPVAAGDVLRNMEILNTIVGSSVENIKTFAGPFSEFTSALGLLSGGKVSGEAAGQGLQQVLSAFGGLRGVKDPRLLMDTLFKHIAAFAPDDPERIIKGIRTFAPMANIVGAPLNQVMALATLRSVMSTSGLRAAGRDLEALYTAGITAVSGLKGSDKAKAKKMAQIEELGITRGGRPAIIDPKTGAPDVFRLLSSMNQAMHTLRDRTPKQDFYSKLLGLFLTAFPEKIGARLAMAFAQDENLRALAEVAAKAERATGMAETNEKLQRNTRGAWERLTSNLENLNSEVFMKSNTLTGRIFHQAANAVEQLTYAAQRTPAMGRGLEGVAGGLGVGILAAIAAWMTGGLANTMAGTVGASMFTRILAGMSRGLLFFAKTNWIGALLALLFTAGTIAYQKSPAFQQTVDTIAANTVGWFERIKAKTLAGLQNLFPPRDPANPKTGPAAAYWKMNELAPYLSIPGAVNKLLANKGVPTWDSLVRIPMRDKVWGPLDAWQKKQTEGIKSSIGNFSIKGAWEWWKNWNPAKSAKEGILAATKPDALRNLLTSASNPFGIGSKILSSAYNLVKGIADVWLEGLRRILDQTKLMWKSYDAWSTNTVNARYDAISAAVAKLGQPSTPTQATEKPTEPVEGKVSTYDFRTPPNRAAKAQKAATKAAMRDWIADTVSEAMQSAMESGGARRNAPVTMRPVHQR